MNSIVDIEIDVPREQLSALYADPHCMTKWMTDLERYDHIGGELGMPGSKYRMVSKRKNSPMEFVVTVTSKNLPQEFGLQLESPFVSISMINTFAALAPRRTRLVSRQEFSFRGLINRIVGVFALGSIRKNHRRHMDELKRFAESRR